MEWEVFPASVFFIGMSVRMARIARVIAGVVVVPA